VLHIPGGFGQEALMEDEAVLGWIRRQASGARAVFSVCAGALLCGAAGLLQGRRATTHWASFHLLPLFGAIPVDERVVVDGSWVFAAGATAGIDGALRLAAELRGVEAAQLIQLYMAYAPEPPFDSGTPETAPAAILAEARSAVAAPSRPSAKRQRDASQPGSVWRSGRARAPMPDHRHVIRHPTPIARRALSPGLAREKSRFFVTPKLLCRALLLRKGRGCG
jgi:cyclohexyl-isocyanide hydratase